MSLSIVQMAQIPALSELNKRSHLLILVQSMVPTDSPYAQVLHTKLKRNRKKSSDLLKEPILADLPSGGVACWLAIDTKDKKQNTFQLHTVLRKAVKALLEEKPETLAVLVYGDDVFKKEVLQHALYVIGVNAALLPTVKKPKHLLKTVNVYGYGETLGWQTILARIEGNTLTRQLTMLPPNQLTPTIYRKEISKLAKQHGWQMETYDFKTLKKMGAGAFVAVAQGSEPQDAAIVHLTYAPKHAKQRVALVGKGICFDTGGHNLKPARYMQGMHEDMNGSAVALGILLAATQAELPVQIDCWLAIAQNHIGPLAYKQNDVVKALNGKTIEIVHTDAEGRMVLADTLTLASRQKPALMIDFATLTGSMIGALGTRYSGVLGNHSELLCQTVGLGQQVGERVCAFPFDADYEEELESSIADIKQCTLDSEADHILAARFLQTFIEHAEDIAWMHVDLSSYNRKGGLGAVASDVNGFGVGLGFAVIQSWLAKP